MVFNRRDKHMMKALLLNASLKSGDEVSNTEKLDERSGAYFQ